ncbi:MAG: prepilin-type N-terminal cleavage/methylation domain-containing protein [Phycisphaerales bacterium]|nr:prepilin-type N-terminal cleavage/methylation domain-containing protein [Phycisphaerales bacterium]
MTTLAYRKPGFTLLELLVVVAVVALLLAILLPSLGAARREGMAAACGARLRELGHAMQLYANDYDGRTVPLAYWSFETIGTGPVVYWWGTNETKKIDHEKGFIWPYLQTPPGNGSVFECPEQPWGSYRPQGAAKSVTSTYGYNGYYLSPKHTPAWGFSIGHRPWLSLSKVKDAARVFAFADTAIDLGGAAPFNNALLDPPELFFAGSWSPNSNPTTSFRHRGKTQAVHVDGHVGRYAAERPWLTSAHFMIGSVRQNNGPHYVPDWQNWSPPPS